MYRDNWPMQIADWLTYDRWLIECAPRAFFRAVGLRAEYFAA